MGLDPATARATLRTAREVINSRQITYPVPYLLVILLIFSTACVLMAMFASNPVQTVALVLGCVACIAAILLGAYAAFSKPELLRSENHQQTIRLIDIIGDSEMDQAARAELMTALLRDDRKLRGRQGTRMGEHDG